MNKLLLGMAGGLGLAGILNYFDFDLSHPEDLIPLRTMNFTLGNNESLYVYEDRFKFENFCYRAVEYVEAYRTLSGTSYDCSCNFDKVEVSKNGFIDKFERNQLFYYQDQYKDTFFEVNNKLRELLIERGLCEK